MKQKKLAQNSYFFQMLLILFLVAVDQITKYLAFLFEVSTQGFFFLQISENKGSAFSIFSSITWYNEIIIILSILIFILGSYYCIKKHQIESQLELVAYLLFGAGLIGNLIDRILFDYVRDFIGITYFAIFNIADVYLCISVALLIYCEYKKK